MSSDEVVEDDWISDDERSDEASQGIGDGEITFQVSVSSTSDQEALKVPDHTIDISTTQAAADTTTVDEIKSALSGILVWLIKTPPEVPLTFKFRESVLPV